MFAESEFRGFKKEFRLYFEQNLTEQFKPTLKYCLNHLVHGPEDVNCRVGGEGTDLTTNTQPHHYVFYDVSRELPLSSS